MKYLGELGNPNNEIKIEVEMFKKSKVLKTFQLCFLCGCSTKEQLVYIWLERPYSIDVMFYLPERKKVVYLEQEKKKVGYFVGLSYSIIFHEWVITVHDIVFFPVWILLFTVDLHHSCDFVQVSQKLVQFLQYIEPCTNINILTTHKSLYVDFLREN
jgi:hypothetical protein